MDAEDPAEAPGARGQAISCSTAASRYRKDVPSAQVYVLDAGHATVDGANVFFREVSPRLP